MGSGGRQDRIVQVVLVPAIAAGIDAVEIDVGPLCLAKHGSHHVGENAGAAHGFGHRQRYAFADEHDGLPAILNGGQPRRDGVERGHERLGAQAGGARECGAVAIRHVGAAHPRAVARRFHVDEFARLEAIDRRLQLGAIQREVLTEARILRKDDRGLIRRPEVVDDVASDPARRNDEVDGIERHAPVVHDNHEHAAVAQLFLQVVRGDVGRRVTASTRSAPRPARRRRSPSPRRCAAACRFR